jgi:hypothetical protein
MYADLFHRTYWNTSETLQPMDMIFGSQQIELFNIWQASTTRGINAGMAKASLALVMMITYRKSKTQQILETNYLNTKHTWLQMKGMQTQLPVSHRQQRDQPEAKGKALPANDSSIIRPNPVR